MKRSPIILGVVLLLCALGTAIAQTTTITGLPLATLPLTCTEAVPAWQLGRTVKLPAGASGALCPLSTAPSSPVKYQDWWDTSAPAAVLKKYDGAQWVSIGTLDSTAHTWTIAGAGYVTSFSGGSTGLTPSSATTGAVTLLGTLLPANGGTGITALGSGIATWWGTPSSANLAAALTDETGSGSAVFANSPSLITPVLGVATATSINKVAITAPASSATLTIANGKTLTASNTLTFTGTDSTSFAFPSTSDTVVTLTAAQTLASKTLTAPIISTISNTGTLTLPTSTDTLVGRATTDTLTNKTLTSPVISGGTVDNAVIGGTTRAAVNGTTGNFNGNLTTNVTGSTQCLQVNSSGVVSGSGAGCSAAVSVCLADYTSGGTVGTTSATVVMSGYGAAGYSCTPTGSKLLVSLMVTLQDADAAGQNVIVRAKYGTGAAPAAGAASAGTVCGRNYGGGQLANYGHSANIPINFTCYISGLTPGVAVWFDVEKNSPNGTSTTNTLAPAITVMNIP